MKIWLIHHGSFRPNKLPPKIQAGGKPIEKQIQNSTIAPKLHFLPSNRLSSQKAAVIHCSSTQFGGLNVTWRTELTTKQGSVLKGRRSIFVIRASESQRSLSGIVGYDSRSQQDSRTCGPIRVRDGAQHHREVTRIDRNHLRTNVLWQKR